MIKPMYKNQVHVYTKYHLATINVMIKTWLAYYIESYYNCSKGDPDAGSCVIQSWLNWYVDLKVQIATTCQTLRVR